MKEKNSITLGLLKILVWFIVGCLFWVIVFSIFGPEEQESVVEPFPYAIPICSIITTILISFIYDFNKVNKLKQSIKAESSNIKVLKKRSTVLLEKANKVSDKYMAHEKSTQVGVAKERKTKTAPYTRKIVSASQFQSAIEQYPDLKANDSIMELLRQIRESENAISNAKITFNDLVAAYNTMIHNFPFSLVRGICKFNDEDYYEEADDVISDEELGI